MLTYENQFLHAVSIVFVPITFQIGVLCTERCQLVGWHRCIPGAGIAQRDLTPSLFKDVTRVRLAIEPTNTLGTNHAFRPVTRHKLIKQPHIQRLTTIIDKGSDTIFLGLSFIVVVVMVVMMMLVVVIFVMMMLVLVVVIIVIVIVIIIIFLFPVMMFDFVNPRCRSGHLVKVKGMGVQEFLKGHITIVALYDFGFSGAERYTVPLPENLQIPAEGGSDTSVPVSAREPLTLTKRNSVLPVYTETIITPPFLTAPADRYTPVGAIVYRSENGMEIARLQLFPVADYPCEEQRKRHGFSVYLQRLKERICG